MYIRHKQFGISLIELILFVVIVSIALAGILLVMNRVTGHSADPLIRKQEIAIAESMLEEIQLQDFTQNPLAPAHTLVNNANRFSAYHIVSDYGGPYTTTTGYVGTDGNVVPGLTNYNVQVTETPTALGAIPSTSSVLITVTVTNNTVGNALGQVVLDGYRTAY